MSVVIAVIAVFPVLTGLMIGLAKAENVLFSATRPRGLPAELPAPAAPVNDAAAG